MRLGRDPAGKLGPTFDNRRALLKGPGHAGTQMKIRLCQRPCNDPYSAERKIPALTRVTGISKF